MKEQLKKVEYFQDVFKIENNYSPVLIGEKGAQLRYDLGKEELDEYLEACHNQDLVAIADALGDQLYILLGTINRHGMQNIIEDVFNEIHRSNLSKLEPDGSLKLREDGKILKGSNYTKPSLKQFIND